MWPIILALLKYGTNRYKQGRQNKEDRAVGHQVIKGANDDNKGTIAQGVASPTHSATKNRPADAPTERTTTPNYMADPNAVKDAFDAGIGYKPQEQPEEYKFTVPALNEAANGGMVKPTETQEETPAEDKGGFAELGDMLATMNTVNALREAQEDKDNQWLGSASVAQPAPTTPMANPLANYQSNIGSMLSNPGQSASVIPTINSTGGTFNPLFQSGGYNPYNPYNKYGINGKGR